LKDWPVTQLTIHAQVVNGHLLPESSLAEIEGQRVVATLTVVPNDAESSEAPLASLQRLQDNSDFDPEPPPWLQVEQDLHFPMTVPAISLGQVKIKAEMGKPSIILPAELPDE
jgi:hypothetical protein